MKNGDYIFVVAPEEYPGKKYRGRYCYEHILVAWNKYGRLAAPGEEVHHKNENKHDNTPDNIEYLTSEDHKKHHGELKKVEPIKIPCSFCDGECIIALRTYKWAVKNGRTEFHCSRSCSIRHQHEKGLMHGRKSNGGCLNPVQGLAVNQVFAGSNPAPPAI